MTHDFENMSYNDADRIGILENRAAELERRLLAVMQPEGLTGWLNVATPGDATPGTDFPGLVSPEEEGYADEEAQARLRAQPTGGEAAAPDQGGRTEALINHGRPRARRRRGRQIGRASCRERVCLYV